MAVEPRALSALSHDAAHVQPAMTTGAVRRALAAAFAKAGLEQPDADARLLLQSALSLDWAALASATDRIIDATESETISGLAERRLRHEPVAHIVGVKEFWGLRLSVTADTLIPRPDTETVVEAALAAIDGTIGRTAPLRLADLGTGSGALLLALLTELPRAFGIGTDISAKALAVARANAECLELSGRAIFAACNFSAALRGEFDLIVSNPPYIATGEIASLAPDVRSHEPLVALDGGADGLAAYRVLARQCPPLLTRNGRLVVEVGSEQARAVASVFSGGGLDLSSSPRRDLAGIERALILQHR